MNTKFSKFIWGTFLLLVAAFILLNQLNSFADIGIGSIIIAALSFIFLIQCIAESHFAVIPIPLAVLYIIFQAPLQLPPIRFWILILASVFATSGLAILLPRRYRQKNESVNTQCKQPTDGPRIQAEYGENDNTPSVNVNFGTVSRHLCADGLKSARLNCSFGTLEVFLDQVELSPDGAEVFIDCSFGAIKLYVPGHWRTVVLLKCTLGGVDTEKHKIPPAENAPLITLSGSVSFGGIEVRYL